MLTRNMKFLSPDGGGGSPAPINQPGATPGIPDLQPSGAPAPVQSQPQSDEGRLVHMPSRAIGALKREAREKGANEVRAQLDSEAQKRGFTNHAAMLAHLDQLQGGKPKGGGNPANSAPVVEPKPQLPKNRDDRAAMARYERDVKQWQQKDRDSQAQLANERKLRKRAERQRDAAEARAQLERIASQAGIVKLGQAIYLFEERHRNMSRDDLAKIDEAAFFQGLRSTDPYLFNEVTVPATTGTSGGPPSAPAVKPPTTPTNGMGDAMKMNRTEWQRHQQSRGIRASSTGLA